MTSHGNDATPRTAGHALHDVIDRVRSSGQQNVLLGWVSVLGAEQGSIAWAQRHAEVVGLYQTVLQQILSLPDGDAARERAMRYAFAWYRAVVWQNHWQHNAEAAGKIIDDAALDQLGSTADLLAYRFPGAATHSSDDAIARLRSELEAWLVLLQETDDLARSVREEIAGQIEHVLWLLDNIEMFGATPVVREARIVVSRATETVAQRPQSDLAKRLSVRIGGLIAVLGLFTGAAQATTQALEAAQKTATVVSEIVRGENGHHAQTSAPPALPSGSDTPSPEVNGGHG